MKERRNDYEKVLFIVDMNNGFVNFGAMANPKYNDLVPEQIKAIEKIRKENELVIFINEKHDKNAIEFKTYAVHCVEDTDECKLIPEFQDELNKNDTEIYYKNCINGMLNRGLQDRIKGLINLKEAIVMGVCADLCVADFTRTLARFLDEINKEAKVFVIEDAIDTFDVPGHNREEYMKMAKMFVEQAGATYVKDVNELENIENKMKGKTRKLVGGN